MALYNVSTAGNSLLAIAHVANCESEIINQDVADNDFESIRDTRVYWRLNNISSATSTADLLVATCPIYEGDRIFIRKLDGTIYDTTAQGVVAGTSPAHPTMTSNTLPEGVALSSLNATDAYKSFDGDDATYPATNFYTGDWIQYQFPNNEPIQIFKIYIKLKSGGTSFNVNNFVIEGSLDGVNFSTISNHTGGDMLAGYYFDIESPGAFSYYRLRFTSIENYNAVNSFILLDSEGTTVDTTAVTLGEVPTQVFKFTDKISFNGSAAAIQKDVFYEYGTTGTKLAVTSLYNDYALGGRTLKTRIDFTNSGDEVVEVTGQIFKAV